jgi:hypothetical protein
MKIKTDPFKRVTVGALVASGDGSILVIYSCIVGGTHRVKLILHFDKTILTCPLSHNYTGICVWFTFKMIL